MHSDFVFRICLLIRCKMPHSANKFIKAILHYIMNNLCGYCYRIIVWLFADCSCCFVIIFKYLLCVMSSCSWGLSVKCLRSTTKLYLRYLGFVKWMHIQKQYSIVSYKTTLKITNCSTVCKKMLFNFFNF